MGNAPMRRSVPRIGRDPDDLRQLALALLLTKHQPLGILLARGVIPLVSPDAASSLIDWVMEARRQLTLDADDPINDIADMVSTARREASETDAALRETRELLELKAREAREAKESRDQALREVKRREEEMARKREAEAAMATPEEVAALKEWRRKAEKYEQEIRERNTRKSRIPAKTSVEPERQTAVPSPTFELNLELSLENVVHFCRYTTCPHVLYPGRQAEVVLPNDLVIICLVCARGGRRSEYR